MMWTIRQLERRKVQLAEKMFYIYERKDKEQYLQDYMAIERVIKILKGWDDKND